MTLLQQRKLFVLYQCAFSYKSRNGRHFEFDGHFALGKPRRIRTSSRLGRVT